MKETHEKDGEGFTWHTTRIGFITMLLLWFNNAITPERNYGTTGYLVLSFAFVATTIFVFVNSIVHLTKYQNKVLAITALVMSSIVVLLFFIGIILRFVGVIA